MARVNKYGLTSLAMKAAGQMTRRMVSESSSMLTVMFMKEIGKTTKQMDREHTLMQMEPDTQESGRMINSMVKEWKLGLIMQYMKGSIRRERKTGEES